ncbi:hypothetical protein ACLB2K_061945 [Fragaria x ananassa]
MGFLLSKLTSFATVLVFWFCCFSCFTSTDAYDPLDPNGNITIRWDIKSWNPDGYLAMVTTYNYQQYRHIQAPGWSLGWAWKNKEVIWDMVGGQATEQGDCSRFKTFPPHCCKKKPTIVDLLPGTPYNKQVSNCCKGGVLSSWMQDPVNAAASFQLSVGQAGTTNKKVKPPENFTLMAPGPGYTCGALKVVKPTKYFSPDKRRVTQAMMTWKLTCTYSQFLAQKTPACCVSLPKSPYLASVVSAADKNSPLVRCTHHMCPIRVHWHIKLNYREYWRLKVTITNFDYRRNYSDWNLVMQHPNFDNLTQVFSFNSKSLTPYGTLNDTAMLWGIKFYNDMLMQSGPVGNVQSELLFHKNPATFTFEKGWAFPRRISFNGDTCVMPPPDAYPYLPNAGSCQYISLLTLIMVCALTFAFAYAYA